MSYFVAISGASAATLQVPRGRLIPAKSAQLYFRSWADDISATFCGPVFLWDDGESDTSDVLVCEACDEIQLLGKSEPECALASALPVCERANCTVHIWWPSRIESKGRFSSLPVATTAEEAIRLFAAQAASGQSIGLVLHPNYAFKRTAGTGHGVSWHSFGPRPLNAALGGEMSDIEASGSRPAESVPRPQSPSLGWLLHSLLAVPPILAVAAWLTQWQFEFPPGSSGASLTALGLVIGIAVPIVPFPIALIKLVRQPALRTFGNVAITLLAGVFAGLAVLIALALFFR